MGKSLTRRLSEWLLGGGALVAIVGGFYNAYVQREHSVVSQVAESCKRADEAIRDDALNSDLTPIQRQEFLRRKLKISEACDRKFVQ